MLDRQDAILLSFETDERLPRVPQTLRTMNSAVHSIGIDLAWGENAPSGLCVASADGTVLASASRRTLAEIVEGFALLSIAVVRCASAVRHWTDGPVSGVATAGVMVLTLLACGAAGQASAAPLNAPADPRISWVETTVGADRTVRATVHLVDGLGTPTTEMPPNLPYVLFKAVRPPYSGAFGAWTTQPSPNDTVQLLDGGEVVRNTGAIWVRPGSSTVTGAATPNDAGTPTLVAWILDLNGNGVPLTSTAAPVIAAAASPPPTASPSPTPAPVAVVGPVASARPGSEHAGLRGLEPESGPDPIVYYNGIPGPSDISLAPPVLMTNGLLAVVIAVLVGVASLLLNAALHHLPFPTWKRRKGEMPTWQHVAIVVALLILLTLGLNPGTNFSSDAGRVTVLANVIAGLIAGAISWLTMSAMSRRGRIPASFRFFVPGAVVAVVLTFASRAGELAPGIAYTEFGGIFIAAGVARPDRVRLHLASLWIPFVVGFLLWILLLTGLGSLALYNLVALTLFFVVSWTLMLGSLPLALTEARELWSWRRTLGYANLVLALFIFIYTLINPANVFVDAVRQQRTQSFLIMVGIFVAIAIVLYGLALFLERRAGATARGSEDRVI